MEADDLLCSRNARPQKALVGRAQWKIHQSPSLEKKQEAMKGQLDGRCLFDARSKGQPWPLPPNRGIGRWILFLERDE